MVDVAKEIFSHLHSHGCSLRHGLKVRFISALYRCQMDSSPAVVKKNNGPAEHWQPPLCDRTRPLAHSARLRTSEAKQRREEKRRRRERDRRERDSGTAEKEGRIGRVAVLARRELIILMRTIQRDFSCT